MKVTEHISDHTGLETLDVIGRAGKFNHWMYSAIAPYCKGQILEVGSGIGNISDFFIHAGSSIHLSDFRNEYCNFLQEKLSFFSNFMGVTQLDLVDNNFDETYPHLLNKFDTVFSLNVLEHIEDHGQAIVNANKLLKPGGKLIILVPAYPSLFCQIDKGLGHFRRYTSKKLKNVVQCGNFKVERLFHFNAIGIFAWFIAGKILKREHIEEGKMNLFNSFVPLFKFFDWISFRKIGLSLIIVASKPDA